MLRARYHLDEPLPAQYWHWLTSALHGDLGDSIALRESVNTLIRERAGVTLELVALRVGADPAARDRLGRRSPGCGAGRWT